MTNRINSPQAPIDIDHSPVPGAPKPRKSKRKLAVIGGAAAVLIIGVMIGKAGGGSTAAAAAPAPAPAPVTVTAPGHETTVTEKAAPPVTVTETAPLTVSPKQAAPAAEYAVTYKVNGVAGSPVGLTWDSGVYDPTDPNHGIKQEDRTLPMEEVTATLHKGDTAQISASLDFQEPGKIESCEIWANGVKVAEETTTGAGTYASCVAWL